MSGDFVVCKLCGRHFGQITASHLRVEHNTTVFKYKQAFPGADLVTGEHVRECTTHLWNHGGVCLDPGDEKRRRGKIREALLGRVFTEEHCRHLSERPTGWQSTERSREANSRGLKAWWAVPENRDRRVRQIREGLDPNLGEPNGVEKVLGWYLDYLYPGEWKFNSGWFILAGKVPDFVNVNGKKRLIEMFGDYWHGPDRVDWDEEGERKQLFSRFGYDTLVVWESEVYYGSTELSSKLKEFCGRVL